MKGVINVERERVIPGIPITTTTPEGESEILSVKEIEPEEKRIQHDNSWGEGPTHLKDEEVQEKLLKKLWLPTSILFKQTRKPEEKIVYIPIARIHCPRVDGCTASWSREKTQQHIVEGTVKLLGIGGGNELELKFTEKDKIEARGQCIELLQGCRCKVRYGDLEVNNQKLLTGYRLDWIDSSGGQILQEIPSNMDLCNKQDQLNKIGGYKSNKIDLSGLSPDKVSKDFEYRVTSKTSPHISAKVDFDILGISVEIGIEYHDSTIRDLSYSYHLVGGKKYQWYKVPTSIEIYWSV